MVRVVRVGAADLERGEHLALLFAVDERVVVLHGDEGCESVLDGVIYRSEVRILEAAGRFDALCMAWTKDQMT